MNHEPVSFTVAWLNSTNVTSAANTITSLLDSSDPIPALVVARCQGGPLSDAFGVDTVSDWVLTLYAFAGTTGIGERYPDHQAAHSVVQAVVNACRDVSRGDQWANAAGCRLIGADVLSTERGVDEAGNARATITLQLRIAD